MKSLSQIESKLAAHKGQIFQQYNLKNLAIFGSYARNEQKRSSDLDILVEFKSPIGVEFIDLANYLEQLLRIKVDLVSKNGIKQKYLREIKNDLKYV
jgi:predicted nucleotidyltransferase